MGSCLGLLLILLSAVPAQATSTGTGFFVSSRGHIVTNAHVISDGYEIKVLTSDEKFYSARVLSVDDANDLALLKIEKSSTPALSLKSTLEVEKGATVYTLGFPNPRLQGFEAKYTSGEISSFSGLGDATNMLQITTPIQPGNSGGPLIDQTGNVVGVVVAKLNPLVVLSKQKYLPENVNFAVKSDHVLPLLRKIPRELRIPMNSGRKLPVSAVEKSVVMVVAQKNTEKQAAAKPEIRTPKSEPFVPPVATGPPSLDVKRQRFEDLKKSLRVGQFDFESRDVFASAPPIAHFSVPSDEDIEAVERSGAFLTACPIGRNLRLVVASTSAHDRLLNPLERNTNYFWAVCRPWYALIRCENVHLYSERVCSYQRVQWFGDKP